MFFVSFETKHSFREIAKNRFLERAKLGKRQEVDRSEKLVFGVEVDDG